MTNLLYSAKHYQIKTAKDADRAKNEADRAKSYAESLNYDNLLNKNMITNCITEIPQDIKLELKDGVLTLKAGSRVYVPNGFEADGVTPKFDVVVISTDTSRNTALFNGKMMLFYYLDGALSGRNLSTTVETGSGTTLPSNDNYTFYNTSDNKIYVKRNNQIESYISSFPIGVATVSGGVITSIDQVFNGFGFISSTVFVLPGVKGLIPNGRNEDGSLKNVEYTTSKVSTRTMGSDYVHQGYQVFVDIYDNINVNQVSYDNETNFLYAGTQKTPSSFIVIATQDCNKGVISNFTPKLPFRAVDYSDSSWIAGQAMPSGKYQNLTLGASDSWYTAPANGWVHLVIDVSAGGYLSIQDNYYQSSNIAGYIGGRVPFQKGQSFYIGYGGYLKTVLFKFFYAEGEAN